MITWKMSASIREARNAANVLDEWINGALGKSRDDAYRMIEPISLVGGFLATLADAASTDKALQRKIERIRASAAAAARAEAESRRLAREDTAMGRDLERARKSLRKAP